LINDKSVDQKMIQAVSPNTTGAVAHITPTLRDTLCANNTLGAVLMPLSYCVFNRVGTI